MNEVTERFINDYRGILLYFGNAKKPYGLAYDHEITEDMVDDICNKIKQRMLRTLKETSVAT